MNPGVLPRKAVRAAPGKNLVIIYMESLERIYTDGKIFPGLTPNLNRYRAKGLDFAGYLTFRGADYTMAALFSSQCGAPYYASPNPAFLLAGNNANTTTFQPTLACLGDVLHAAGYEQAFMNGVSLSFADQGAFFRIHGFNQVLGLHQLEQLNGGKLPAPGWGFYDSDLFRLGVKKFDQLAASGKPFNLDMLTIDNHPPHGRPSPGCPKYAANDNRCAASRALHRLPGRKIPGHDQQDAGLEAHDRGSDERPSVHAQRCLAAVPEVVQAPAATIHRECGARSP